MAKGRARIWDLSPPLAPGLPVWPGDTRYRQERTWAIGPGCPVNVSKVTLSTHSGSHADAPLHYDANGAGVGALDLSLYVGPARLIDVAGAGATVRPEHVRDRLSDVPERLILRTYATRPLETWDHHFTAIAAETIELLADHGVRLVATDAPSVDPETSTALPAHNACRRRGVFVVEGLVLDAIPEGDYELIALPLKLVDLDAAPLRAVLRELPG